MQEPLFEAVLTPPNLLPCDGLLQYFGPIMSAREANSWFEALERINWRRDEVRLYGKTHVTERQVAWFSDETAGYAYSGSLKAVHPFNEAVRAIQHRVEDVCQQRFNACLANRYASGEVGLGWHQDNETQLVKGGVIASVSLGAARRFLVRHKASGDTLEMTLDSGSLLLMGGVMQQHWKHSLPKMMRIRQPRINLTFRQMRKPSGSLDAAASGEPARTQTPCAR